METRTCQNCKTDFTIEPDDFDFYLLVGDETALPAIARRLEELRASVPVTASVPFETMPEPLRLASVWVVPPRSNAAPAATSTEDEATSRFVCPPPAVVSVSRLPVPGSVSAV